MLLAPPTYVAHSVDRTAIPTTAPIPSRADGICVCNRNISPTLIARMTIVPSNVKFFHCLQHGTLQVCAQWEKTPRNDQKRAPNNRVVKRVLGRIDLVGGESDSKVDETA